MKKKNVSLRLSIVLIIAAFFLMVPVNAKWIINRPADCTGSVSPYKKQEATVVAYVDSDTLENKYTSVEAALAAASKKNDGQKHQVVVIPGTDPVIKQNCVVSNNVELVVPYGNAKSPVTQFAGVVNSNFALLNASPDCILTIDDQVKVLVDNGGKILVNGQVGANSSNPGLSSGIGRTTGCTFGQHAAIYRSSSSSIEIKGGSMDCWGLIREVTKSVDYLDRVSYKLTDGLNSSSNSSLISVDGGTINLPFTVYDWQGGAASVRMVAGYDNTTSTIVKGAAAADAVTKSYIFPMEKFDCPNIYPKMAFSNKAILDGNLSVYMDNSVQLFVKPLVAETGLIQYTSGTIYWDFENNHNKSDKIKYLQQLDNHKTYIECSQVDGSIGSMSVKLTVSSISKNVDTSDYFLPLGSQFSITVGNGSSFDVSNKIVLFPGCDFLVEEGAACSFSADACALYSPSESGTFSIRSLVSSIRNRSFLSPFSGSCTIVNHGTITFSGRNGFGGNIVGNQPSKSPQSKDVAVYLPQYNSSGAYDKIQRAKNFYKYNGKTR
mgnify:CR=1 FL=1